MKKILLVLAMLFMLSTACLGLAGCDYTTGEIGKIDYDPESKTIYWEPVSGADNYTVFENGKRLLNTNDTKFLVSSLREDVSYITVAPTKYMKDTDLSEEYLYISKGTEGVKYNLQNNEYYAVFNEKVSEGTVINVQSVYENLPVTEVSIFNDYEAVVPDTIKKIRMGEFRYKTFRVPLNLGECLWTNVDCELYSVSKYHNLFSVKDGILYNKDLTKLISYPTLKKDKKYTMPDSVVEISEGGLYQIEPYLTEVILSPNLVKLNLASICAVGIKELRLPSKIILSEFCLAFLGNKLILNNGITDIIQRSITLSGDNITCDIFLPESISNIAYNGIVNNKLNNDFKTTIHCAAKEKPIGWHEEWQEGCEVIWGENW